jgi:hypothetical protein
MEELKSSKPSKDGADRDIYKWSNQTQWKIFDTYKYISA